MAFIDNQGLDPNLLARLLTGVQSNVVPTGQSGQTVFQASGVGGTPGRAIAGIGRDLANAFQVRRQRQAAEQASTQRSQALGQAVTAFSGKPAETVNFPNSGESVNFNPQPPNRRAGIEALAGSGDPQFQSLALAQLLARQPGRSEVVQDPQALGLREGTVAQRGPSGQISILQQPQTPTANFVPVKNAQDQIVAQRNTLTGQVTTDPRAVKDAQSDIGQLLQDQRDIESQFGKDSEQARAMKEAIQAERRGDPPKLTDVAGLRKEFTTQSKDFIKIRDAFGKIKKAIDDPSAAGDLGLIFNFMKMLDPGSVVRESEFATAQNAAGVPDQVRNLWNRAKSGERLNPEQRQDFSQTAGRVFASQLDFQTQLETSFRGIAKRSGFKSDNVVVDFVGDLRGEPGSDLSPEELAELEQLRRE